MPDSSSLWAMRILSSTRKEISSACVPSLSVVSYSFTRLMFPPFSGKVVQVRRASDLTHRFDPTDPADLTRASQFQQLFPREPEGVMQHPYGELGVLGVHHDGDLDLRGG